MHAADLSLGILGANGIVGGGFGIATGAALSCKKRGSSQIVMCFFGDGAVNQGIFYETMNIASLWKLPLIYVCENNEFGEFMHYYETTVTNPPITARAEAFGLPAIQVDGNNVIVVYEAVKEAVERARSGEGPSFIEASTYRFRGHSMGDEGFSRGYRTKEEMNERWKQEPIGFFQKWLVENSVLSGSEMEEIESQIESEIQEAVDFVNRSPFPDISEVVENIYA